MKIKFIISVLSIIAITGCGFKNETYIFKKTSNISDKLRLDGFYYWQSSEHNNIVVDIYYQDGVVRFWGTEDNIENVFTQNQYNNTTKWGVYLIRHDSLFVNYLMSPYADGLYSHITTCIILNDTTFQELYTTRSDGEVFENNTIWHFREYSPKPDSTGSFKFIK